MNFKTEKLNSDDGDCGDDDNGGGENDEDNDNVC